MQQIQSGILQAIPQHATYLTFALKPNAGVETVMRALLALLSLVDGRRVVLGVGASLMQFLGGNMAGFVGFTTMFFDRLLICRQFNRRFTLR